MCPEGSLSGVHVPSRLNGDKVDSEGKALVCVCVCALCVHVSLCACVFGVYVCMCVWCVCVCVHARVCACMCACLALRLCTHGPSGGSLPAEPSPRGLTWDGELVQRHVPELRVQRRHPVRVRLGGVGQAAEGAGRAHLPAHRRSWGGNGALQELKQDVQKARCWPKKSPFK